MILLKNPAATAPASSTRTALLVLTPFTITQFFSVSFTIGVVPIEPNRTTLGVVTLVLVMVRLRSVPPEVEPSIVTRLAPFRRINAVAEAAPEMARAAPVGLIVIVNGLA